MILLNLFQTPFYHLFGQFIVTFHRLQERGRENQGILRRWTQQIGGNADILKPPITTLPETNIAHENPHVSL